MRLSSLLPTLFAVLMLTLAPAMAAPVQAAAAQGTHGHCNDTAQARKGTPDAHKGSCLAQCVIGHGGVLPHGPSAGGIAMRSPLVQPFPIPAAPGRTPGGLDPPPPRLA
jgi:hypothetical protein